MAKKQGNAKAEIRWEPTEFRCWHWLLLYCKSKSSTGFADIMKAHPTVPANKGPADIIMFCRLFNEEFRLDRVLLVPFTPRNTLLIVIFQLSKCRNISPKKQPQRAISAYEKASCSGYARCNDATSTNNAPINSWTIVTRTRDCDFCSRAKTRRALVMCIIWVDNQKQLMCASFNTKNKGSQSQMMNSRIKKCAIEGTRDIDNKAFLESFVQTITAQVVQKKTRCAQNAACAASREATSNSTIAVTARTRFKDQEMHMLRLSWVQSWRLVSVLLESWSCWAEKIMSDILLYLVAELVTGGEVRSEMELVSAAQFRTTCSLQYEAKRGINR
jgi:hypothetical protein